MVIFGVLISFRRSILTLISRIISDSKEINVELAGQKISVVLAREVVRDAIEAVVRDPAQTISHHRIEEVTSNSEAILLILSQIEETDIQNMRRVAEASDKGLRWQAGSVPNWNTLVRLGLITCDEEFAWLTDTGKRVLRILNGRSLHDTLTKIAEGA